MVNYSAGSASIAIRPDLRDFRKKVKAALQQIDSEHAVDIVPDTDKFRAKLDGFLSSVDSSVDVDVNLNKAITAAEIDRLVRNRTVDVDVDVDTAAAQLQVAALDRQVESVNGSILQIGASSVLMGTIGTVASGAIAPITSLAVELASVSGALVPIPAMAGAAGTALAGIMVGSMGVSDAFSAMSGDASEFETALAELAPTAAGFMRSIYGVKDEWADMQSTVQNSLFEGLGESVETLTTRQLPNLTQGLSATNTEINRGLRASIAQFSTEAAATDFSVFLDNSARSISGLALAAAPLSQIWIDISTVGSEYLPGMARSLGLATQGWSTFISEARQTGQINDFIEGGIDSLGQLAGVATDLGGTLVGVLGAAYQAGNPMLDTLGNITQRTRDWVESADGNATLTNFFQTTSDAVADLATILPPVAETIVSDLIPGFAGLVSGAAPGVLTFVEGLASGLDNVGPNLALAGEGAGDLLEALAPLSPVLSESVELIGAAGSVLTTLSGPLELVASLLGDHPQLVLTAAAAWGTWKYMPGVVDKLSGSLSGVGTSAKEVSVVGSSIVEAYSAARTGAPEIGRFGAGLQVLGGEGGVASAALDGVKRAGSGVLDFFGGPWGVGLMAATGLVVGIADASHRASEAEEALAGQSSEVADAQAGLVAAVAGTSGALGEDGLAAAAELARAELITLVATGEQMDGFLSDTGVHAWNFEGSGVEMLKEQQRIRDTGDAYKRMEETASEMGLSVEDVYRVVAEGGPQFNELVSNLRATDEAGQIAADELENVRQRVLDTVDAARQLDPGMREAADAVGILADESSSANDKFSALNSILQLMGLAPKDAERAMRDASESIAELAEKAVSLADPMGALGDSLFGLDGNLDTTTANGRALFDQLDELGATLQNVAVNGGDTAGKFEEMQPVLQTLKEQFGLTDAQMQDLINHFGLVPETLDILVGLQGADSAQEELAAVLTGLTAVDAGATVEVTTLSDEAKARLEDLGITVTTLPNGNIQITDNAYTTKENVKKELDGLVTHGTHIQTLVQQTEYINNAGGTQALSRAMQANGSVRYAADGWLSQQDAMIVPGGSYVTFGEDETDGESLIPHAKSKRHKSEQILIETAGIFGLGVVNKNGELLRRDGTSVAWDGRTSYFADGAVRSSAEIDDFAQGIEGKPYVWGGVNWGDCSGAMSAIARFATGLEPFAGRFATGNQREALLDMGFTLGIGSPGDLRFGWFNGGPWGGHTSGTLPSGVNVEMGGSRGDGQYGGGAAGANDPQYTDHAYLPVSDSSFTDSYFDDSTYGYSTSRSSSKSASGVQVAAPLQAKSDAPTSWSDVAGIAASAFAKGMVSDALGVFGIPDSPPALQAWGMWQDATSAPSSDRTIQYVDEDEITQLERDLATKEEELRIDQLKLGEMDEKTKASTRASAELSIKKKQQDLDDLRSELMAARVGDLYKINDDGTLGSKVDEQIADSTYEMQQAALKNVEASLWEAVVGKQPMSGMIPEAVTDPLKEIANQWGVPLRFAMGGTVPFIGGPVADAVPALLSAGEHVTRSLVADQARPLLDAMNSDPGFARALNSAVMSPQTSQGETTIEYHIHAANADEGIRKAEMMERRRLAAAGV
ncbi:hypothetical protein SFC07_11020 [Corynebacterium callunae]|uniref:hypothetical protein n=1 Tax=Corynebacterium callunae TaxID=1721 RepID=UPI00398245B1